MNLAIPTHLRYWVLLSSSSGVVSSASDLVTVIGTSLPFEFDSSRPSSFRIASMYFGLPMIHVPSFSRILLHFRWK